MSFAIPINVAKDVIEQIKNKGYASRGWLGVMIQDVDQSLAESFGLTKPEGALVAQVTEDSPALEAGLKVGDIILEFNGHAVNRSSDLPPLVGSTAVNTPVPVVVMRSGDRKTIDVKVGELQSGDKTIQASQKKTDDSGLGATVQDLTAEEKSALSIDSGVAVLEVDPNGASAIAGIIPGDILVSFNRETVTSVAQLRRLVKEVARDESFPVLIQRKGSPTFIAMTIQGD